MAVKTVPLQNGLMMHTSEEEEERSSSSMENSLEQDMNFMSKLVMCSK